MKHLPSRVGSSSDELPKIDATMSIKVGDGMEVVNTAQEMSNEDARTKWDTITMNLAYLLAAILRVPDKVGGLGLA